MATKWELILSSVFWGDLWPKGIDRINLMELMYDLMEFLFDLIELVNLIELKYDQ